MNDSIWGSQRRTVRCLLAGALVFACAQFASAQYEVGPRPISDGFYQQNYGGVTPVSFEPEAVDRLPSACGHDCCSGSCRCECCKHCTSFFAEFLYMQVSGVDMVYGIPQDGLGAPGVAPIGAVGSASPTYEPGFRFGLTHKLDECTSLAATYTWYESSVADAIAVGGTDVINPTVVFPGTFTAGNASQSANARYDIDFQSIDIDYRVRRWGCHAYAVNWVLGVRYAHLEQDFQVVYPFAAPDGITTNTTDITFDGGGLRFGLDGERHMHKCSAIRLYGKAFANVLSGRFQTTYLQDNQFDGREVTLRWEDDRFIAILEGELGLAWRSKCNHWDFSFGYNMAAWMNVVSTPAFVSAVQTTDFSDVDDTITFDGLVARIQLGW